MDPLVRLQTHHIPLCSHSLVTMSTQNTIVSEAVVSSVPSFILLCNVYLPVTLQGESSAQFAGFFIQARKGGIRLGTFQAVGGTSKTVECDETTEVGKHCRSISIHGTI